MQMDFNQFGVRWTSFDLKFEIQKFVEIETEVEI